MKNNVPNKVKEKKNKSPKANNNTKAVKAKKIDNDNNSIDNTSLLDAKSVIDIANEEIQQVVIDEYKTILDEANTFRPNLDVKEHAKEDSKFKLVYGKLIDYSKRTLSFLKNSSISIGKKMVNLAKRFFSFAKYKIQHPINHNEVRRYKIFFVSDMEEESRFLHEMSIKGFHFKKKWGIEYIFEKDIAKNYYYHIGYYEKDKRDGERYQLNYEHAGWLDVYHEKGEFDGVWHYFRLEVKSGEVEPKIFSDRVSRTALYNRLLSNWRTLLAMIVICLLFMVVFVMFLNSKAEIVNQTILLSCSFFAIIMSLIFIVYIRIYLKIKKKLTIFME